MIVLILLAALFLRLINLNQSFWLDEAINVNNVANLSFKSLIFDYSLGDFHPPLYHLILKSWVLVFPVTEISTRIPSVILGVLTVFITYLISRKLFEKGTALIAAILIATSPLHIYYSQEARMYMLAAFLVSMSVYFFISLLKRDSIFNWIGFVLSTALTLYADYIPYLLLPTYIVYLALFRKSIKKTTLLGFIPAFILIVIFLVPWLLVFPKQLTTGLSAAAVSPAWAQVVGGSAAKDLVITFIKFTIGRISHENNIIYALLFTPVAIYTIAVFMISMFRLSALRTFLWFWLFIPIFSAFAISHYVPIFSYFRLIFTLPALYIIWASAINTINARIVVRLLLFVALAINLISISIHYINPKFQRENWRGATQYIHKESTQNTIVLFESPYSVAPFDFYNENKVMPSGALNGFTAERQKVIENVKLLTSGKDKVFLFQYLSGITDPSGILFEELTNTGFKNVSATNFDGVGFVYEFTR